MVSWPGNDCEYFLSSHWFVFGDYLQNENIIHYLLAENNNFRKTAKF